MTGFWDNKRIVITGGSAGLGRALAIQLNKLGARVLVIARGIVRLKELQTDHPEIMYLQADIADKDEIYPLVASINVMLGGIDVLFNNASTLGSIPLKTLIDSQCEEFTEVLETNLVGPFRLTKALLPSMLLQNSGLVVNISSDAAINAYPMWGFYSTSKAALDMLSRIWNVELEGSGVRVLALDPGDMLTDLHMKAIPDADPEQLYQPEDVARDMITVLPYLLEEKEARYGAQEWRERQ